MATIEILKFFLRGETCNGKIYIFMANCMEMKFYFIIHFNESFLFETKMQFFWDKTKHTHTQTQNNKFVMWIFGAIIKWLHHNHNHLSLNHMYQPILEHTPTHPHTHTTTNTYIHSKQKNFQLHNHCASQLPPECDLGQHRDHILAPVSIVPIVLVSKFFFCFVLIRIILF